MFKKGNAHTNNWLLIIYTDVSKESCVAIMLNDLDKTDYTERDIQVSFTANLIGANVNTMCVEYNYLCKCIEIINDSKPSLTALLTPVVMTIQCTGATNFQQGSFFTGKGYL